MKRICFIGDSHTAAIKYAWWSIEAEFPDIAITFFSSPRGHFVDLAVRENTLVPQSDELREMLMRSCKFEPVISADYNRYILCGLDYSMTFVMNKLMKFRSEDQTYDNRTPVSNGCYLRAMAGCLREAISMQVARKVRAITSRPITIVPAPRISDANKRKIYPRLRNTGDAEKVAGCFYSASDIVGRELGADIVRQPSQTLRDPLQTLAVYGKDAPREFRDRERPEGWQDYQHMNIDYGIMVLRSLFAMPGF